MYLYTTAAILAHNEALGPILYLHTTEILPTISFLFLFSCVDRRLPFLDFEVVDV